MLSSTLLQNWYLLYKRDLPWRRSGSAYHIWLSEIIMQQTRIDQGISYYHRFVELFPDIHSLAAASIDDVLNLWQGLGYYSRAVNMHRTACEVVSKFQGVFPDDYNMLLQLKGIGPYSAAAIASIAFNKPYAVVDGNVSRVLSRLYAVSTPIDETAGKKVIQDLATQFLDPENPGNHNQAMMELGALICLPRNPQCTLCVFSKYCRAFIQNQMHHFPVKAVKNKVRIRYLNFFFIEFEGRTVLKKRTGKDIWKYLFEFPMIETDTLLEPDALKVTDEWKQLFGNCPGCNCDNPVQYRHKLTHQLLVCNIYRMHNDLNDLIAAGYTPVSIGDLNKYAFPVLINRYLRHLSKDFTI